MRVRQRACHKHAQRTWYSKLRPPQGTRAKLTPGPNITFVPFAYCNYRRGKVQHRMINHFLYALQRVIGKARTRLKEQDPHLLLAHRATKGVHGLRVP